MVMKGIGTPDYGRYADALEYPSRYSQALVKRRGVVHQR